MISQLLEKHVFFLWEAAKRTLPRACSSGTDCSDPGQGCLETIHLLLLQAQGKRSQRTHVPLSTSPPSCCDSWPLSVCAVHPQTHPDLLAFSLVSSAYVYHLASLYNPSIHTGTSSSHTPISQQKLYRPRELVWRATLTTEDNLAVQKCPFAFSMVLKRRLHYIEPQFPHLGNGGKISQLILFLRRWNYIGKHRAQMLGNWVLVLLLQGVWN